MLGLYFHVYVRIVKKPVLYCLFDFSLLYYTSTIHDLHTTHNTTYNNKTYNNTVYNNTMYNNILYNNTVYINTMYNNTT